MQAISGARKKLFSSRKTCSIEVNDSICRQSSLPDSPSSVGASVESQFDLASPDFGFEFLDYPDGDGVFDRHSSFDANLFELRRQAPEQIAAQLTLLNLAAFKKITPKEFRDGNWMKKQKAKLAPNLLAFTRQFNHMCFWVEREVLEERSLKLRADTVGFFIRVAKKLHDLDNFHGMVAVVSALQSAPIHRLSLTWKSLPKKDKQQHDKLAELASSDNNHVKLREQMNALRMPCIPHLALYLTDLAFLTARQSSDTDPQIQTKIDAIVNTVIYFQQSNYEQLSHHKYIQVYLQSIDFLDELQSIIEREFFQKSKELEPDSCGALRPYRSSDELLDQGRMSSPPPEVRSPAPLIKALCLDRLLKRNNSWSNQHGQDPPLHDHTRSASVSPTTVTSSSLVDSQRGVAVQVTEASPETNRRGTESSFGGSLSIGAEDMRGFDGSLPVQGTKKAAGQLSPLASRTVSLSFGRRRGHRKSSSLGSNVIQSTGNLQGKSQARMLASGGGASGVTSGMTSSISLLDDSLLTAPSPACSGSESSDDEDTESPTSVGFSRLSEEDYSQWQQQGSLKEGVLKRQLLRTGAGPVSKSLQKKVKCTANLTESSLIMVKGKQKQPPKSTLLQVLPFRDCYVSFTDSTGRSSDKKQFIIADEKGFAVRFISSSVQDAESWVCMLRGAIEDYNRKLTETSLIKL